MLVPSRFFPVRSDTYIDLCIFAQRFCTALVPWILFVVLHLTSDGLREFLHHDDGDDSGSTDYANDNSNDENRAKISCQ